MPKFDEELLQRAETFNVKSFIPKLKPILSINRRLTVYRKSVIFAIHLGHTISSVDRIEIVKSAINNFWRHLNMFMSNFSSLSASMRNALFNQFCCSFYGSPLWLLKSGSVQSLCVNWRKALR